METVGFIIGRFCPIHIGHQNTIDNMINEVGENNSLIIIGSASAPLTIRNLFNYEERRKFIKTIYPNIKIVGLPDVPSDNLEWKIILEDLVNSVFNIPKKVLMFGGSKTDIWYHSFFPNWNSKIINRNDVPQTGTDIRELLINNKTITGFVSKEIEKKVIEVFKLKWKKLCSL